MTVSGAEQNWLASWLGEAVNWECDELGHLNMRHYVGKAEEARRFLFIHLGLAHAFQEGTPSSVRPREITTCYLREARPGARLSIRSGITRLGEVDADLLHIMEHADGTRAATIEERVEHVALRTGEAFPWPKRLRKAAEHVRVSGEGVGPRGLPTGEIATAPVRETIIGLGAARVGAGVFRTDECDVFGHVRAMAYMGRCSESVGNFRDGWPEAYGPGGLYDPEREGEARLSGVLLELRLFLHEDAEAGRAYEVHSAVKGAGAATRHLIHHIVDPVSGVSYASMSATSAIIDLQARKLVKAGPEQMAALNKVAIPEMTP